MEKNKKKQKNNKTYRAPFSCAPPTKVLPTFLFFSSLTLVIFYAVLYIILLNDEQTKRQLDKILTLCYNFGNHDTAAGARKSYLLRYLYIHTKEKTERGMVSVRCIGILYLYKFLEFNCIRLYILFCKEYFKLII